MIPKLDRCETCKFWNRQANTDSPNECRRYPPDPMKTKPFPVTSKLTWCGEWKSAKEN